MASRRHDISLKIMKRVRIVEAPAWLDPARGPCLVWTGPHSGTGRGGGYPRMHLDGQTVAVHLVSWTNANGFIPGRKQIDHVCRNRMCVSDTHLELVTHLENQKRRVTAASKDKDNG